MPGAFFVPIGYIKHKTMEDNFKTIKQAFENAGIDIHKAGFSITEYSLNTKLSFKFENSEEFTAFLGLTPSHTKKREDIKAMIIEAGINPDKFFYVNFFKPKVAEL